MEGMNEINRNGQIVSTVLTQLLMQDLRPDFQILSPLLSKLSWSHFLIVMTLKNDLQREFYLALANYRKMIVALKRQAEVMKEIDETIQILMVHE